MRSYETMFDFYVHKSFSDFFHRASMQTSTKYLWVRTTESSRCQCNQIIRLSGVQWEKALRNAPGWYKSHFSSLNIVYSTAGGRLSRGSAWHRVNSPQLNFRMQWELSPLEAFCNSTRVHNLVGLFKIMTQVRTTMQYCVIPQIFVSCLLASQLQWGNYGIRCQKSSQKRC